MPFYLIVLLVLGAPLSADFWSKMFNVKVVNDTKEDMYKYGYQNGYYDVKNHTGRDGRISVQKETDIYFNRGYMQGVYDAQIENGNTIIIYEPKMMVIPNKVYYDENRIELIQ